MFATASSDVMESIISQHVEMLSLRRHPRVPSARIEIGKPRRPASLLALANLITRNVSP